MKRKSRKPKSTAELLATIHAELPKRLGPEYQVLRPYELRSSGLTSRAPRPDVAVRDKQTNRYTFLEVKDSGRSRDLALATAPELKRIKEAFEPFDSKVVLVTRSRISPILKEFLDKQQVRVIQPQNKEQLLSQIVNIVKVGGKD